MDELRFLTAGIPLSTRPQKNLENGLRRVKELGLDGMELEYVRGVVMDFTKMKAVGTLAKELKLTLTAHAPYYINFTAAERPKVDRSYQYVLDTARILDAAGGYSVVFHAAYYLGRKPHEIYPVVLEHMEHLADLAKKEALRVWLRPELMGKKSQFGTLDEVLELAADAGGKIAPCLDLAHLHARTGRFNTYEEISKVLDLCKKRLGEDSLKDMHLHFSGIEYSEKGEQKHSILRLSDSRFREIMKALKDYEVCGVLVCESPNVEGDALMLKMLYESL